MNKTKIDWTDMSWNPVTGCLNDCPYCYARGIARRFGDGSGMKMARINHLDLFVKPDNPYPDYFAPTFHRYRLDEPKRKKKPQNIFVGSMCDLFGDWIPDEWLDEVFKSCADAPWHRYLFLTKNPQRYENILSLVNDENMWLGVTINSQSNVDSEPFSFLNSYSLRRERTKTFFSIEPIQESIILRCDIPSWVIIGAETGKRKSKVIPKKEWIDSVSMACKKHDVPIFMRESLRSIMLDDFVQQYPWALNT